MKLRILIAGAMASMTLTGPEERDFLLGRWYGHHYHDFGAYLQGWRRR